MVVVFSFSVGISIIRGNTEGTCTVANSSSSFSPSFFNNNAAKFKVLFRMSGNGLEESTAIGVRTGYTYSIKYLSI